MLNPSKIGRNKLMLIFLVISLIVATGFGIGAMFLKGKTSLISMMLAYVVVISAVIYICY